ncbi:hypothetical protein AB0P17_16415 [Streptomyces sp. NPDC088124]|uniref:hypothetical protein n=1 Tax=Streptomyces sp. NPDC088124 TaxID=3154654 RepID=UPI003439EDCC
MRGDDAQRNAVGGDGPRVRKGPRHAAPKKSLLTKFQIPAGKAMALAAMPTAVFVGMGLTPRLAMAEGSDDIPFAPGPCVTRSDEPSASASETPSPSSSATKPGEDADDDAEKPGTSPSPSASDTAEAEPGPSASESGSGGGGGENDAQRPVDPEPTDGADSTATPAPSESTNPLDPLGLGDALGDLLGVSGKEKDKDKDKEKDKDKDKESDEEKDKDKEKDKEKDKDKDKEKDADEAATGSPSPDADSSAKGKAEEEKDKSEKGEKDKDEKDGSAKDDDSGSADSASGDDEDAKATKDAIKEAARKAGAEVEELDDDAKGLTAREDDDIPAGANGKEPYPCPTPDPDALAAATEEPGLPLLPDDPWTLHSSLLTLNGLDYKGIVEVRTYSGKVKKVLKFTASSLDIKDLNQTVVYPQGRTAHVETTPGSTSTIRDGEVTMYTEELKGNLFGLIPITFSPQTPPPLNVPFAFFTDVKVTQAGQFGGTLTLQGLHNYITG